MNNTEIIRKEESKWIIYLYASELTNYLNLKQTLELSKACKKIRNKLEPIIFQFYKYFPSHLRFLNSPEYNELTGKDQIEAYNARFMELFEPVSRYVKRLHVSKKFNRYRVLSALAICPNLTNLKINGMALPYETLNQMAINSPNLQTFTLECIRVIQWTDSPEDPKLTLISPSVTNLNLINCMKMISPLYEDPYNWENDILARFSNFETFNPIDLTFPNLTKVQLILNLTCSIAKLNEFILRHGKLESIFIWFNHINQETIKILSQMNLKSLRVSMSYGENLEFHSVVPRILSTVKKLEFTELIPECNEDICKFLTCFNNLKILTIDYTTSFNDHIAIILSNSQNLEELTLLNGRSDPTRSFCIPKSMKDFNLTKLPANSLRVINFKYIHPTYIEAELFENCIGLKMITISEYLHYKAELDTSYNALIQNFNHFEKGWRANIYNSDDFINLYKFSNSPIS